MLVVEVTDSMAQTPFQAHTSVSFKLIEFIQFQTFAEWNEVWYITSAIVGVAFLFYLVFGSGQYPFLL